MSRSRLFALTGIIIVLAAAYVAFHRVQRSNQATRETEALKADPYAGGGLKPQAFRSVPTPSPSRTTN
jgi:hypothetical protein